MVPFKFVQFSNLASYKDSSAQVDVLGVVLQMLPAREQQTKNGPFIIQEMIIINEELQPTILTMWNQFVDNEAQAIAQIIETKPIVAAMRLKVVSFNGMSLSTRSSSSLLINPNIPDVVKLQNWLSSNVEEVEKIMKTKFVQNLIHIEEIQAKEEVIQISSLSDLPDNRLFWLKCSVKVINIDQPLWYMCCSNCHRSTTATYMQIFNCNYCKRADIQGIPRCRIDIEATDSTGSIEATLFGEVAEKVIGCAALKLMQITKKWISFGVNSVTEFSSSCALALHIASIILVDIYESKEKIEDVITVEHYGKMMLHLKAYTSDFHGETKRKFNINEVIDDAEPAEASQPDQHQHQLLSSFDDAVPTEPSQQSQDEPQLLSHIAEPSDVSQEERQLTQEAPPSSQEKTIL